jgi:hypothetical protein
VTIKTRAIDALLLVCTLCVTVIALYAFHTAAGQDAISRARQEAERLEKALKENPIPKSDLGDVAPMVGSSLTSAKEALSGGHLYLGLERLDQAENLYQGGRVAADKAATVKDSLSAFQSEWDKAAGDLEAQDREAHQRNWKNVSSAVRALSETAQARSIPLLEGAQGFAVATKPTDGLFYLGQAQGEAAFAGFCASLSSSQQASARPSRSLLPELQDLQQKTNTAFQPPRSIELHPRFIALNSTLKLAGELDSTKSYAGALYQYLEAVRHYGMLEQAPLEGAQQIQLKTALSEVRKRLEASRQDDSIAQIFLERAESQIAHPDGSAPSGDELRSAQVIVSQVIPAYYAAQNPPPALKTASGKTINVTLVRWPYT